MTDLPQLRRTVTSAEIDLNGHMNSAHYFSAHVAAARAALSDLGITESYVVQRQMGTFAVEHHLRYFAELTEGDTFTVRVQMLERSDKAMHLQSVLSNAESGETVNVLEVISVHVDLTTRRATPIPSDVSDRMDQAIRSADAPALPTRLTLRRQ